LDDLKKALAERALNAGMDHHLTNGEAGNSRNGYGKKHDRPSRGSDKPARAATPFSFIMARHRRWLAA
jgi:hypothetical protein